MVTTAVEKELAQLPQHLADSTLGALALAMATEVNKERNSATRGLMCARAVVDALETLRSLAPVEKTKDALDELLSPWMPGAGSPIPAPPSSGPVFPEV